MCTASGWAERGDGPNCTYIGSRELPGQLLIGSCARNVRAALQGHSRAWVESLLGESRGSAVIFEDEQRSGDPDGTRQLLQAWAASDGRVRLVLAQPLLYPKWSRTQRLALCRNTLVSEARRLPPHGVFVSIDLDCHAPHAPTVMSALSSTVGQWGSGVVGRWDVLTANTLPPAYYYDRWALRSSTLGIDYDCWFNRTQRAARGSCPDYAITIDTAAAPFAVDSAFNGLGLYRASALRAAADCRYRGTKNSYLCEHVPFHLCLRSHQLSIGVLPSLTVSCGATTMGKDRAQRRRVRYMANGTVELAGPPNGAVDATGGKHRPAGHNRTTSQTAHVAGGHHTRHRVHGSHPKQQLTQYGRQIS